MQEKLVEFNTAVLAKQKGFNGKSNYYYAKSKTRVHYGIYNKLHSFKHIAATTQSSLQKWLREEHNCIIEVTFYGENIIALDDIKYAVEIDYYGKNFNFISDSSDYYSNGYNTYEEALEVGLFNALKLIK